MRVTPLYLTECLLNNTVHYQMLPDAPTWDQSRWKVELKLFPYVITGCTRSWELQIWHMKWDEKRPQYVNGIVTIERSEGNANDRETEDFKGLSPSQFINPALSHQLHDYENRMNSFYVGKFQLCSGDSFCVSVGQNALLDFSDHDWAAGAVPRKELMFWWEWKIK